MGAPRFFDMHTAGPTKTGAIVLALFLAVSADGLEWSGASPSFSESPQLHGGGVVGMKTSQDGDFQFAHSAHGEKWFFPIQDQAWRAGELYAASAAGVTYLITGNGLIVRSSAPHGQEDAKKTEIRMVFEGANQLEPHGRLPFEGALSFFRGSQPSEWFPNMVGFSELVAPAVYDGIDLEMAMTEKGLKYTFRLAAGVDPTLVRIHVEGAQSVRIDGSGRVTIDTPKGQVVDDTPEAYQADRNVQCRYVMYEPTTYGFGCDGVDSAAPLTIDPLIFATYVGGSNRDVISDVVIGPGGRIFVAGYTESMDFPTSAGGSNATISGGFDVFVMKLSPDATTVEYATFVGGSGFEQPTKLLVDGAGNAYVAGQTNSTDFPTTSTAWRTNLASNATKDSFVFKLNGTGVVLDYSTLIGGTDNSASAAALDVDGSIVVVGSTSFHDIQVGGNATTEDLNPNSTKGSDVFLIRLSPAADNITQATFLGGGSQDNAFGLAMDSQRDLWVTGFSQSVDFPTTAGAFQKKLSGPSDAFLAKLNGYGNQLLYSSYIGGSNPEISFDLAIGPTGDPVLLGHTFSRDLPTSNGSFQTQPGRKGGQGTSDCFVARFDGVSGAPTFVTYLGGALDEYCDGDVRVASDSTIYLAAFSEGLDFPTTPNAYRQSNFSVSNDTFLVRISADGSALYYSTLIGGDSFDYAAGLAILGAGQALVAINTLGSSLPTTPGAFGTTPKGPTDGYLISLEIPNPTLFVNTPMNGTSLTVPSVRVEGLTDPRVELSVDGITVGVAANGTFGVSVALQPGLNAIIVRAVAPDGQISIVVVFVNYQDPVPALVAEIASLQTQLNETRRMLNGTIGALSNMSSNLSSAQNEIWLLDALLAGAREEISQAESNLSLLYATVAILEEEVSLLRDSLARVESTGNNTTKELDGAKADLLAAIQAMEKLEADLDSARESANGTAIAFAQLQSQISEMKQNMETQDKELVETREALNRTGMELDHARNDILETRTLLVYTLAGLVALGLGTMWLVFRIRRLTNAHR